MISFRFDDPRARPGEQIRGTVAWSAEQKAPKAVIVAAGFVTEGRGDSDELTVFERTIPNPATEGTVDFAFDVPIDAPCTYDGQLIRVRWRVTVRLDLPWAIDAHEEAPFAVVAK